MVNKIKWVPIYLWVCALHVHSMPTSATNFKDPAFGPYFELSTRHSLKPTTTIDYDQADFDEFGNDPGLNDVLGSPDTINIDPDDDQGPDYQAGADPGTARYPLLPLYTNTPDGVTPIRGSGGISDENRTGRYRAGYSLNDSTAKPANAQNKAASDSDNRNIGPDKQKMTAEDANKENLSTKSADDSNSTNLVANGTDVKQSAAGGTESHMDSSPGNNDELSNKASNNANDNKQGNKSNANNTNKEYVNNKQSVETDRYEKNDKTRSGNQLNNNGPPFQSDESASKDVSSSESTSRDNSAQTDSESYETRYTSASSESGRSGGSASDTTSGESNERNSGESNSAEYSTYTNGQKSSPSVAVVSSDMTREERMDLESLDTSKSKDLSGDVDRSSDISTSNESGNSASDETGSSTSNESVSKASGESVSDESGDGATRERTDSASMESGGASTREKTDSTSIERSEDVTRENANGVSDERVDNDLDEKSSSTKKSDINFSDETGSDSHSQGSPEVNSSEENYTESSGSKSNISTKDDDISVSYEVPNSSGEQSPTSNRGTDKSDESLSPLTHANNDYMDHNGDMSGSKSNKLVECFRQTVNDTDCFLLRSLYSICWNQFSSKCWSGVSRLRKTKMSHLSSSNSGSSSFRSYDSSSESADVDDPFSDSLEASDSSSDASSKSLSLETIENLSASYEKANGIFEVIMLIKEACPSICALAESAKQQNSFGNGQEPLHSLTRDSSESSDEDDIFELSTDSYSDTRDDRSNANIASSQPTYTRYASESNSIDVTVDTSSGSSNDDSQSSSDTSSDYSYENYSASDNTSE